MSTGEAVSFEHFRQTWLEEVQAGDPPTTELGRRFAVKLVTQWLDHGSDDAPEDLFCCDRAEDDGDDGIMRGDTWYLVQSKYECAFRGSDTLLKEGQKVVDTLDGKRAELSSLADDVVHRLPLFRQQASSVDRIVLVFAMAERPIRPRRAPPGTSR